MPVCEVLRDKESLQYISVLTSVPLLNLLFKFGGGYNKYTLYKHI